MMITAAIQLTCDCFTESVNNLSYTGSARELKLKRIKSQKRNEVFIIFFRFSLIKSH